MAAFETWAYEVATFADVFFMLDECEFPPEMKDIVVCLNISDNVSTQIKAFKIFKYLSLLPEGKYDFILKIDLETYVNFEALRELLQQIDYLKSDTRYLGIPELRVDSESGKLDLTPQPYCMGFGYILTAPAAISLANRALDCLRDYPDGDEDIQVGICFCFLICC